ncbi:1,6-anhydro-N-acetylmuramyl-L-alanine amidase AmpD [Paraburkholderia phymatum]|uniref:1,6-anhydro-N-acetylmuramyl-L-alanine amidase AmpD n=1 Tax=Paraburkholderia phymatum (strain DSM 17167 / CIP 108236 / LMG 21445 / STM815) TaxID=391038 RepID=B2JH28_PARP8|nr:1,6-anhydro-N-acetylmuramyl-L-alanine amidase AmpD [Paraburkholderia phymatum]ACC71812.1 N-acetylmuramyl-L-alanine amidase, negative regulator of AmpC, AmpD [Paraburkholderia phymatum STM815]
MTAGGQSPAPAPARFTVDANGWVDEARQLPSPNFEARPNGARPTLIVVHNISLPPNEFGGPGITDLFLNRLDCDAHPYYDAHLRDVRVSAHFVIRRDGALEQYVSCDERAWHAGASNFFGRERCNDFSIGIELEGSDASPFERAQYATLAPLVRSLAAHYEIDSLAGHSDIAPGRKTDPGPHFEWPRLQRETALPDQYFPYLHPSSRKPIRS